MHRRVALCLLAGFAFVATATATAAAAPARTAHPSSFDRPVPHLMVWEVPPSVTLAGPVALRVEVLRKGRPIHADTFTVSAPPHTEHAAVEILAAVPEKRALFAGLAASGDAPLEVRILRGGQEVDRLPLSALLGRGAEAVDGSLELLPLRYESPGDAPADSNGGSGIFAKGIETDCSARDACRQECWNDYFDCVDRFCPDESGTRLLPEDCDFCADERFQCELGCPGCQTVCTEPKSVTYSTFREPVSATWVGFGCYGWDLSQPGTQYDQYYVEYKYTRYKHTEACDGTVTTTIDTIWYEAGYCWDEVLFSSCSFPTIGTPGPLC